MKRNIHFDSNISEETSGQETLMERLVKEAKKTAEKEIEQRRILEERKMAHERELLGQEIETTRRKAKKIEEDAQRIADSIKEQARSDAKKIKEDAQRVADSINEAKRNELNREITARRKELEEMKNAQEQEQVQRETALQMQIDEINNQIQLANMEINNTNCRMIQFQEIKAENEELKKLLETYKKMIERLLGRSIKDGEVFGIEGDDKKQETNAQATTEIGDMKNIQPIKCANNGKSVFECSNTGNWTQIGQLVLEIARSKDKFRFNDNKVLVLISKLGNIEVGRDGFVLEKGMKNTIIAIRMIIKEGDKYKNLYRFYSSSQVVPIYQFLSIANFILHIFQTDMKVVKKESKATLECLAYSDQKHKSVKGCAFERIDDQLYHLKYDNATYESLKELAMDIYSQLRCSKKGIPEDKITELEQNAFIKSLQLSENRVKYNWIKNIKYITSPEDLNR